MDKKFDIMKFIPKFIVKIIIKILENLIKIIEKYYLSKKNAWWFKFNMVAFRKHDYEDFRLRCNGSEMEIISYNGADKILNIPAEIYGFPVTKIGRNAFYLVDLEEVSIPSTLTDIGEHAFLDFVNIVRRE